jgi:hypothetical protein
MITGKTSKMIARDLGGSYRTIEIHRSRVMAKMETTSLAELVRMNYETESDGPGSDASSVTGPSRGALPDGHSGQQD